MRDGNHIHLFSFVCVTPLTETAYNPPLLQWGSCSHLLRGTITLAGSFLLWLGITVL